MFLRSSECLTTPSFGDSNFWAVFKSRRLFETNRATYLLNVQFRQNFFFVGVTVPTQK